MYNTQVVDLVSYSGSDADICQTARVSTLAFDEVSEKPGTKESLIKFLMDKKHGTPFESNFLRFYVKTPIFVAREFFRHRIGWSYNETSTRYRIIDPEFYTPPETRPIIEGAKFKPASPVLESGDLLDRADMEIAMEDLFDECKQVYYDLIERGIAREVARNVLPLATYTHFFASCNLRSFMHFLSLRTYDETARDVSRPLWEIDELARMMEALVIPKFPLSMAAYNNCGRRAP